MFYDGHVAYFFQTTVVVGCCARDVCVIVCVHEFEGVCTNVHNFRGQRRLLSVFLCHTPLIPLGQGLSLTRTLAVWARLAIHQAAIFCFSSPCHTEVIDMGSDAKILQGFLGFKLMSSSLYNKHFTHWLFPQAPTLTFFIS